MILLCCIDYLLILWFDILHAVAELNRASNCIAADSDYFEVFAVPFAQMLWAKGRAQGILN